MEIEHLSLYSIVLSILMCCTEIHQADATSIQHRSCDMVRCPGETHCVNGKCVKSCDEVDCGPGQECTLQVVQCFTIPCNPIPTCKPINRCKMVDCSAGFTCIKGSCVKVPTCKGVVCGPGEKCELEEVQCFTDPCPPIPTCKPDRCAIVRCRSGYKCFNGKCVKEPTCEGVVCDPWEKCELEEVQCFTDPCPPIPTCKPDRCAIVRCRSGYKCFNGKCVKEPTCEGFKCGDGEECYLQNVNCIQAPCLPVPSCRPKLTCATINCIAGTVCVDNKCIPRKPDRCATVRCRSGYKCFNGRCLKVPTCEGFKCRVGEECYLKDVYCIQAPCLPVPACRPELTCATIKCKEGNVCVDKKCIPAPTCKNFVCEAGTQCYLESPKCTNPPCPPPQPVCRASCALILCPAPSNCVNGQCLPIKSENLN